MSKFFMSFPSSLFPEEHSRTFQDHFKNGLVFFPPKSSMNGALLEDAQSSLFFFLLDELFGQPSRDPPPLHGGCASIRTSLLGTTTTEREPE